MNDLVAKRYAKAVSERADANVFYEHLQELSAAFSLPKFKLIIDSYELKKEQKLEFVLSFFDKLEPKFENFLRLLSQNSRLDLIPDIAEELSKQRALKASECVGVIYSKESIAGAKISELEEKLSKKFNTKISLQEKASQTDGVKISLEDLGYEISFSLQNLESKICDYILKAI